MRLARVLPALVIAAARGLGAGGTFAWRQPEIGHELARIGEAMEVADLRDNGNRRDRRDPAQGLNGSDDLGQRPGRQKLLHLLGQADHGALGLHRSPAPVPRRRSVAPDDQSAVPRAKSGACRVQWSPSEYMRP